MGYHVSWKCERGNCDITNKKIASLCMWGGLFYYVYTVTFAFTYYFTSVTCTDSSQCGQGERCNIALDAPDGDCRQIVYTRAIYIQTGITIL